MATAALRAPGENQQVKSQLLYRERVLDNTTELDQFLAAIQGRAFRMAQLATGNTEDALDLVQDTMFKLVQKYSERPATEWQPLFYRILHSRINDWYRRNSVRSRHLAHPAHGAGEQDEDPIQNCRDPQGRTPEQLLHTDASMAKLQSALTSLPLRQQQAFLLRAWEGMDVRQTAQAMACAEGSVKSLYSRAIHSLREQLGEFWP